jgi:hypothetical protein
MHVLKHKITFGRIQLLPIDYLHYMIISIIIAPCKSTSNYYIRYWHETHMDFM